MTIEELRKKFLSRIPASDADLLLQIALNKDKVFLLTRPRHRVHLKQQLKLHYLLFRYRHGEPVAYLAKNKEFYGLNFFINKHTLIPRPDTETLVEEALKNIPNSKYILVDVGTGSGCIPISILKNTGFKPVKVFAVDISGKALAVAKKNSAIHGTNIEFIRGDLLRPVNSKLMDEPDAKIIITANLPYLTEDQFENEPSIRHEPKSALVAKEGGLKFYRILLGQIRDLNRPIIAFLEIDPEQAGKIPGLISSVLPGATTEIKTDLAGRKRIVIIKFNWTLPSEYSGV